MSSSERIINKYLSQLLPPALWSDRTVENPSSGPVSICGPMAMPLPRRSDSGKSPLGPASRDAGRLEEDHFFVQLTFTEPKSFL
jgi:hypothetical protein